MSVLALLLLSRCCPSSPRFGLETGRGFKSSSASSLSGSIDSFSSLLTWGMVHRRLGEIFEEAAGICFLPLPMSDDRRVAGKKPDRLGDRLLRRAIFSSLISKATKVGMVVVFCIECFILILLSRVFDDEEVNSFMRPKYFGSKIRSWPVLILAGVA